MVLAPVHVLWVKRDQSHSSILLTVSVWLLSFPMLMLTFPLARTVLGHNGFLGSQRGISSSWGFSTWPFHGLFIRWGDTRTQSSRRGLYLVCWYSVGSKDFSIFSSVEEFAQLRSILPSAILITRPRMRSQVSHVSHGFFFFSKWPLKEWSACDKNVVVFKQSTYSKLFSLPMHAFPLASAVWLIHSDSAVHQKAEMEIW